MSLNKLCLAGNNLIIPGPGAFGKGHPKLSLAGNNLIIPGSGEFGK
jgi:hypothetical protein